MQSTSQVHPVFDHPPHPHTDVSVKGSGGRISVFVGSKKVAQYKNEDVVNWGDAFVSFTGTVYPMPVICHGSQVMTPSITFLCVSVLPDDENRQVRLKNQRMDGS